METTSLDDAQRIRAALAGTTFLLRADVTLHAAGAAGAVPLTFGFLQIPHWVQFREFQPDLARMLRRRADEIEQLDWPSVDQIPPEMAR